MTAATEARVPADARGRRRAMEAGVLCYALWGLTPVLFIALGRLGASPWEIVAQRAMWAAPWAALLVAAAGQMAQVRRILASPRTVALLAASAALIALGWAVFVYAVNTGGNLEASLGYYITPLLNMAAGAILFRERLNRWGRAAIILAVVGVALQTLALGRLPLISLVLAFTFWGYGLIRRRVDAEAQAGLLVECLLMAIPGAVFVAVIGHGGHALFGRSLWPSLLMTLVGPATVVPLALFSWTARRLPFSAIAFLQFISPTEGFVIGLVTGERLTALGLASFAVIWAGVAVFAIGAWRGVRPAAAPP